MNEALTFAQSCPTIRVRQNRDALGAEFNWGQLAEAHERWGDRNCRSMQRVRHQGMADVLPVNENHNSIRLNLAQVMTSEPVAHPAGHSGADAQLKTSHRGKRDGDGDMGIIAKRPIANAAWGAPQSSGPVREWYRQRARAMLAMGPIPEAPQDPILLALGFILAHEAVDTAIVGTGNPDHMKANTELVENALPISAKVVQELHRRFGQLERSE
jgi:hypothetical protein